MYTNRTEFAQNQLKPLLDIARLTFTYENFTKLTPTPSKVPLRFTELKLIFSNGCGQTIGFEVGFGCLSNSAQSLNIALGQFALPNIFNLLDVPIRHRKSNHQRNSKTQITLYVGFL